MRRLQHAVLVTRTGPEGQRLTSALIARGFDAHHLPLVRLAAVADPEQIRRDFHALPRLDGLILTSREGVRRSAALGLIDELKAIPTVVPGEGTRALARQFGLEQVSCPGRVGDNSEAMLATSALQAVAGRHWLILAASDGRRLLDEALQGRGAVVHRLTVYRRVFEPPDPATLDALGARRSWITLLASGGALDRLRAELPPELWERVSSGTFIVPSERLHARALALGVAKPIVSTGASDEAMIAAMTAATTGETGAATSAATSAAPTDGTSSE